MSDDRYPYVAGHRGVGGSVEAAEVITTNLAYLQAQVVKVIGAAGSHGATGDEIARELSWEKYRVRPRTSELRKLSRIMDSRKRRRSEAGISSIVWVLPQFAGPLQHKEGAANEGA